MIDWCKAIPGINVMTFGSLPIVVIFFYAIERISSQQWVLSCSIRVLVQQATKIQAKKE
jgi:hypothetical protein